MMELEIRDVQSSAIHRVPEKGAILGRQGGGADLLIAERTISSKHCRLYAKDGKWMIEDLRSSNGTFVNGVRITAPTVISAGAKISLCRYAFEVVRVVGGSTTDKAATFVPPVSAVIDAKEQFTAPSSGSPEFMPVSRTAESSMPTQPLPTVEKTPPRGMSGFEVAVPRIPPSGEYAMPMGEAAFSSDPTAQAGLEPQAGRVTAEPRFKRFLYSVISKLPKSLGYYVTALPRLFVHPADVVRKGIAEKHHPVFGVLALLGVLLFCGAIVWALVCVVQTSARKLGTTGEPTEAVKGGGSEKLVNLEAPKAVEAPAAAPVSGSSVSNAAARALPSTSAESPVPASGSDASRPAPTAYQEFVRKREVIEAAIDADPTLLKQREVLPLYQELRKTTNKVKAKCGKTKPSKKGAVDKSDKRIAEKLCEAEIFEQTGTLVDRIHRVIVESR